MNACMTQAFGPCQDTAVAYALWKGCIHGVWYCARHRDRALADPPARDCPECGRHDRFDRMLTGYEAYRETWLNFGGLANKDAMVAEVTLDEPRGWDIFGSIMAPEAPPKPARRKLGDVRLGDKVGPVYAWMLVALGILAVIVVIADLAIVFA